jgi:hypothetical protein
MIQTLRQLESADNNIANKSAHPRPDLLMSFTKVNKKPSRVPRPPSSLINKTKGTLMSKVESDLTDEALYRSLLDQREEEKIPTI